MELIINYYINNNKYNTISIINMCCLNDEKFLINEVCLKKN